ncbi:(2Fe-2S)-binding protein, partial [Streptomyces sp. NPDC050388]
NVRGPATAPQPAFDTRVLDGQVEVRLRRADRGERVSNDREAKRQRAGTGTGAAHGHSS